jgi:hypothetical protein
MTDCAHQGKAWWVQSGEGKVVRRSWWRSGQSLVSAIRDGKTCMPLPVEIRANLRERNLRPLMAKSEARAEAPGGHSISVGLPRCPPRLTWFPLPARGTIPFAALRVDCLDESVHFSQNQEPQSVRLTVIFRWVPRFPLRSDATLASSMRKNAGGVQTTTCHAAGLKGCLRRCTTKSGASGKKPVRG